MNNLLKLLPYVRSGTAEGDSRFLSAVFVSSDQLADFCGIEPGSMRVLVGNKGTGKSAIVEWIHKSSANRGIPSLLIRPDDLADNGQPSSLDMSTLKAHFYEKLLRSVCAQVGAQIHSKKPLVGDAARLYNEARLNGISREDLITKSLDLLSAISIPAKGINGASLAQALAGKNPPAALIRALNTQLLQNASKVMYLLIDDTDQVSKPNEPDQLNRIWALILAARKLAMQCSHVRPIVTLRHSVWVRLIHEDSAQRDQFDHIRPLVMSIQTSDSHIEKIVEKRLVCASIEGSVQAQRPYENFFEGNDVLLPTSSQRRSWHDFIVKSSRERPRDALQLIKAMIEESDRNKREIIGDREASSAMVVYSGERVDDIVAEYSLDCPSIRTVIDSFISIPFDVPFETLRSHLLKVPSITSISLRRVTLKPDDNEDAIKLLALLHEFGFLNARVPDVLAPRKFRHINYSDAPTFVRQSNWNNLQSSHWEVHPAFRSHLIAVLEAKKRQGR